MVLECKLARYMGLAPREARRKPLALALLWLNYIAQTEGMETWWHGGSESGRLGAEALREHLRTLRAEV